MMLLIASGEKSKTSIQDKKQAKQLNAEVETFLLKQQEALVSKMIKFE